MGYAKVSGTSAISPGLYGICTLEHSPSRAPTSAMSL